MERCRKFLFEKSPAASGRAMQAIRSHYATLRHAPKIGRPVGEALRELVIPFGDSAYLALYAFDEQEDVVQILAFRHAREAGY